MTENTRPGSVTLRRAALPPVQGARPVPGWVVSVLRVPLAGKLAGANALIVVAVIAAALANGATIIGNAQLALLFSVALGGSLVVNIALVVLALRPLRDLEMTAERIWHGDLAARVPPSLLADAELARLGSALNVLLDGLTSDREQMRKLAAEVIRAGDRERAYIARELHDGAAQTLAALVFQTSVLERENRAPELAERVATVRQIASDVLEEVRALAHTVHPRVLDDLGLVAALRHLARLGEDRSSAEIVVDATHATESVPPSVGAVLYRVAQEAVGNAIRHASPKRIAIVLSAHGGVAKLQVVDDGIGFDPDDAAKRRPGMGLFTMRERVSLIEGHFEIQSAPGRGTRVIADVPYGSRTIS